MKPCFYVYIYAISEITVPCMPLLCPEHDPLLSAVSTKVTNTTFLQPKSYRNTTLLLHDTGLYLHNILISFFTQDGDVFNLDARFKISYLVKICPFSSKLCQIHTQFTNPP